MFLVRGARRLGRAGEAVFPTRPRRRARQCPSCHCPSPPEFRVAPSDFARFRLRFRTCKLESRARNQCVSRRRPRGLSQLEVLGPGRRHSDRDRRPSESRARVCQAVPEPESGPPGPARPPALGTPAPPRPAEPTASSRGRRGVPPSSSGTNGRLIATVYQRRPFAANSGTNSRLIATVNHKRLSRGS
jgi:hypothetical protein